MRILMLTDDRVIDRRILQEAESLIDRGHEVILIAAAQDGQTAHEWAGRVKVERIPDDVRVPSRRHPLLTLGSACVVMALSEAPRLRRLLRGPLKCLGALVKGPEALVRVLAGRSRSAGPSSPLELAILDRVDQYRPDLIHAHDLPRLRVAVHAKRQAGVPLIYDAHELYPEINTLSPVDKRALERLEGRFARHCDRVITVNPFIAREMARRYAIPTPEVLFNAIDRPEGFDPQHKPDRFRAELPIAPDKAILLYQGWMSATRGLQDLVNAMAHVPDRVHLVMMGYGEARAELERIVRDRGLGRRVHFKDAVPVTELLWWTASADAGIIPYRPVDLNNYYCSPNKLFEFIQASLPLIVNDLPFLRQVVGQEGFGVVAPLDGAELIGLAISEMFDPARGGPGRFRPRLLARASEYNWTHEESRLLAIYRALCPEAFRREPA